MNPTSASSNLSDGDPVAANDMTSALTSSGFIYNDGATQTFVDAGTTTYVERGRKSHGDWSALGDGRFSSFWPPVYRASYDLHWIVRTVLRWGCVFGKTSLDEVSTACTADTEAAVAAARARRPAKNSWLGHTTAASVLHAEDWKERKWAT